MNFRSSFAAAALLVAFGAASVSAQSFVYDDSNPYDASPALTDYQTDFNDVGGMLVEWTFTNGSTGSGVWGDQGNAFGFINVWGVSGADFFLGGVGSSDTYFDTWYMAGDNIASFTISAAPGLGVFDRIGGPDVTPGSSDGNQFDYQCSNAGSTLFGFVPFCFDSEDIWNTTVTYSNPVGVGGNAPLGDLYATMTVDFGNSFGAGSDCNGDFIGFNSPCEYLTFWQDMDNVPEGGSVGIPLETVPEPATMTLLATGLAGMAAARRRRNKA